MKKMKLPSLQKTTLTILALSLLGFSSCDKKEDIQPEEEAPAAVAPTPAIPEFEDADAVLVAIKAITPFAIETPINIPGMPDEDMKMEIEMGMGVAVFSGGAKAGSVTLNDQTLPFENGSHVWQPDYSGLLDNPTGGSEAIGIDFSNGVHWEVTNPDFSNQTTNQIAFSSTPEITSQTAKTIDKTKDYTIRHKTLSNAGSDTKILYAIYAPNGEHILKEKSYSSTFCTFSSGELAALGTGQNAIIQVNAYKTEIKTSGGKKFYLINQVSYSLTGIEIQ